MIFINYYIIFIKISIYFIKYMYISNIIGRVLGDKNFINLITLFM